MLNVSAKYYTKHAVFDVIKNKSKDYGIIANRNEALKN